MNKYAFISLLFPNKKGDCTYLDGALLTALGLRKQKTKYKIICMTTPDISQEIKEILKIVYDEVIVVDYISPLKKAKIKIQGDIFHEDSYKNENEYTDICNVFTKLHIFNSELFPYDKVVFVDNDLIPIKDFDLLFDLDTPAGWLEQIEELLNNNSDYYTRIWGIWKNIKHNEIIPKKLTEVHEKPGSSINAGLLVIKPDINIFNDMIKQLQTPVNLWIGNNFKFKGWINYRGIKVNKYMGEQDYLTQYFSGDWKMIDGSYCAWGFFNNIDTMGVHMAGLKWYINNKPKFYKTWMLQMSKDDDLNDITNEIGIWGLENYPSLKNILFKHLKIIIFEKIISINDIDKLNFILLNEKQQKLYEILQRKNSNFIKSLY